MSIAEAFAPIEAANKRVVMRNTWGHLAPEPLKVHNGYILFAHGNYGHITVIKDVFDGLSDSPWYFDALHEFIEGKAKTPGELYRFDGTCMMCKNGKFKFQGKVKAVQL